MAEELSDFIEASGLLEYDPMAIDSIYKKNPIRLLRRLWQTLLPIGLFLVSKYTSRVHSPEIALGAVLYG